MTELVLLNHNNPLKSVCKLKQTKQYGEKGRHLKMGCMNVYVCYTWITLFSKHILLLKNNVEFLKTKY